MESIIKLSQILQNDNSIKLIEEGDCVEINTPDQVALNFLEENGISFDIVQDGKCRIFLFQNNFQLFFKKESFFERIHKNDLSKNILIIEGDNNPPYYWDSSSNKTLIDFIEHDDNFLFENLIEYYNFLDFLKSQEHKEDHVFYFVDYFSWDHRLIVFTSLKKEGKLTLNFPLNPLKFDERKPIKEKFDRFYKAFSPENKHLPKFLKNELFKSLPNEKKEDRFEKLIQDLDEVLTSAEQNFEIYLNDLSLENVKKEYLEHKDKYFQQLRDILGKITNQVIALPLTITASSFATYKALDSVFLLILIILAFFGFTAYSLFNLRLHLEDITDIKDYAETDYQKLKVSTFFTKYPDEISSFEKINNKIKQRITLLSKSIYTYFFALAGTNLLFIIYALSQMKIANHFLVFIGGASLFYLVFIFSFLFKFKSKPNN